jgi:hypothetical protein
MIPATDRKQSPPANDRSPVHDRHAGHPVGMALRHGPLHDVLGALNHPSTKNELGPRLDRL